MADRAGAALALVLRAFRDALGIEASPDDDFFDLGGDSVASEVVLTQIEAESGVALPGWTLLDHPTARAVAALLSAPSSVEA